MARLGIDASNVRDADASGAFANPAQKCWENGMAVGPACVQPFETCQQRDQGAFGPNGGAVRTINVFGSPLAGILGGAVPATLVSIFGVLALVCVAALQSRLGKVKHVGLPAEGAAQQQLGPRHPGQILAAVANSSADLAARRHTDERQDPALWLFHHD